MKSVPLLPRLGALALAGALTLTACGGGTGEEADGKVIVVGATGPMSGPYAANKPLIDSIDAYFAALNDKGGIDGYTVKFVSRDDQYNPAMTPQATRDLVDVEKADLLCGSVGTTQYASVSQYVQAKGLAAIPGSGSAEILNENTAVVATDYGDAGRWLVDAMAAKQPAAIVSVAYAPDGTGLPFHDGVVQALTAKGRTPAAEVEFDPAATDYSSQAAKLKDSGADVVFVNHVASVVARLVNAADKIGYHPTWAVTYNAVAPELLELVSPDTASRMYFATYLSLPDAPSSQTYRDAMAKYAPNVDAASGIPQIGWANAVACEGLIRRALEGTGGKLPSHQDYVGAIDGLTLNNDYVRGLAWAQGDHHGTRTMQLLRVQDGTFVTDVPFATDGS